MILFIAHQTFSFIQFIAHQTFSFIPFIAHQTFSFIPFIAHIQCVEPCYLLEYTMSTNDSLFNVYTSISPCGCACNDLLPTPIHARLQGVAIICAYPLLGAHLFTTNTYKRMQIILFRAHHFFFRLPHVMQK